MAQAGTDFGAVADDLRRAAVAFAALTTSATVFGRALGAFREFERQLTITNAIAQGSVQTYRDMERAARTFALNTTVSATEAATALQNLAQAGFSAEESLAAMSGVLLLAQATFTDVAVASDITTSTIRAFQLEAGETARIANVFSAAITGSLATMDKLAFAMRQVAPVAEVANLSIEETTAFLGQLFNIGLRGEQAGTALRNIIVRLIRPLGEAGDLLERAGIATRNAQGDLRNLADILRDIGNSDLTDADLARIFETEALAGALAAIRAVTEVTEDGRTAYERFLEEITGTDRALELAVQNLDTFDGSMRLFSNTVNDLLKQIGEELAPVIVALTDTIRGWILTFNDLDPATREQIIQIGAWGAAIVSGLAVANAFILVLKGPLLAAFVTFTGKLVAGTAGLLGFSSAGAAAATGLRTLPAILGAVARAFGALLRILPAIAGAAALAFGPAGAIVVGVAASAAGIYTLVEAFRALRRSAAEAEQIRLDNIAFDAGAADANAIADAVLPLEGLEELDSRTERLQRQLDVARAIMADDPLGLAESSDRQQGVIQANSRLLSNAVFGLEDEVAELDGVIEILRERRALRAAISQVAQESTFTDFAIDAIFGNPLEEQLAETLEGLDPQTRGLVTQLEERFNGLISSLNDTSDVFTNARAQEQAAIEEFLTRLAIDDADLEEQYALLQGEVSRVLLETPSLIERIAETLANREGGPGDQEDLLRAYAETTGDTQIIEFLDQLAIQQEEIAASVIPSALARLEAANAAIQDAAERSLLERLVDNSATVAEGIAAAVDLANRDFAEQLREVGDDLRTNFDENLSEFVGSSSDAIIEAMESASAAAENLGAELPPSFADLVSGQALLDAVSNQVDASTTPEQLQSIIAAEQERYTAIFDAFVEALIAAGTLDEAQIEAIRAAATNSAQAATAALEAGLASAGDSVAAATESVTRRVNAPSRGSSGGGGGGGRSAEDLARERLRDARKIEDAFDRARDAALDAQESFLEAAQGFTINERVDLFLELDVEQTRARFDEQIQRLNRELEDIQIDFGGSGAQLGEIQQQYAEAISLIERTRDAEIRAATSFTAQMERRSDSIDLFIRDLENLAMESESSFARVAAGIGIAFAEYQRDLVTLVDITRDAVTGFLDAVTTGIADFIFDNENAWENFKETMLNISRQVFEGFTKSFLQQAISSLTGGGGSIFGNAGQPSAVGGAANSENPSVGTGGLLGGLFGGLGIGGEQGAGTDPGAAQISQGATQVATALQQGAQQITAAFQTIPPQLQAGGSQVQTGLSTTGSQIQSSGSTVASDVQQAGQQLSGSIRNAASSVSASSGGGFGGGGGGFLTSLLGFGLSQFAQGGLVSDYNTARILKKYAEGGKVRGKGTGTSDDILAYLSNGEYVMRSAMTKEFLPFLEAMNNGASREEMAQMFMAYGAGGVNESLMKRMLKSTPAFSTGGLVGDTFGAANITEPRVVTIAPGSGASSTNINTDARRTNNSIVLNVNYHISGGQNPTDTMRRSLNQHAKGLASQIEKAKKNT